MATKKNKKNLNSNPHRGNGLVEKFFNNGQLKMRRLYQSGKLHGLSEIFDENGQLKETIEYKKGEREGLTQSFFSYKKKTGDFSSHLIQESLYKKGKRHGPSTVFYMNGEVKELTHFKNGLEEGLFESFNERDFKDSVFLNEEKGPLMPEDEQKIALAVSYYKNDLLETRKNFKNGKKEGSMEAFEKGYLVLRGNYKSDLQNGLWERFKHNGKISRKTNYKEGKKDGLREIYEKGFLLESAHYKKGDLHGQNETYYESSNVLSYRTNFKSGKKDGLLENFSATGQILLREIYRDGKKDGLSETFYPDHLRQSKVPQVKERMYFKDDNTEGPYEQFDVGGNVLQVGNYKSGRREGLWETFLCPENLVLKRQNWLEGHLHGLQEDFYPNGSIMHRGRMHKGKSIGGWERFDMRGNLTVIDSGADPYPTEPEDSLIDNDIPF